MEKLCKAYLNRPSPEKSSNKKHRSSGAKVPCSGSGCCTSFAQCQQNATAFLSASTYSKEHPDAVDKGFRSQNNMKKTTTKCHNKHQCASARANHKVCKLLH